MDDAIEDSNTETENNENCNKIISDGSNDKLHRNRSTDDSDSDDELFGVSTRRIPKKSTVMSDDEEDSSSESKVLPDNREASNDAKDDTDEDSDQEKFSSRKKRIQRPVETDSDLDESLAADEVIDNTQVKPYQYSRDIFDPDDTSDEDMNGSSALTGGCWQSEEQEEEDRLLQIAKTVLDEKAGKPPKIKKVAESVVRAERAKEVSLIHSESQRRVREGPICLPYHRPKQHSLADFLNRSKLHSLPLQTGKTNLKQSMRNMEVLRQLEATKKEVVEFYKSESEDEDTDDREWTPAEALPANSDSDEEDSEITGKVKGVKGLLFSAQEAVEEVPTEAVKETDTILLEASDSTATRESGLEESEALGDNSLEKSRHSTMSSVEAHRGDGEPCVEEPSGAIQSEAEQQPRDQLSSQNEKIVECRINSVDSKLALDTTEDVNSLNKSKKNIEIFHQRREEDQIPMELGGDSFNEVQEVREHSDNYGRSESPQKRVVSLEDDEDFLPDIEDDISIIRNSENLKRNEKLKLNTQEMEDDKMAELVLLDDKEESCEPQKPAPDPVVLPVANASVTKGPRFVMPPQVSRLAAKLGGTLLLNGVSPASRLPLTADRDGFIDLDDDFASPKPRDPGLMDLMNRFAKHSATKKQRKNAETVHMSIVSKEKDAQGREQLVTSDVAVSVAGDPQETEISRCQTPGRKLQLLKSCLRHQIDQRRAQSTRARQLNKNFLETETVEQDVDDPFALPEDEEVELTESEEEESEPDEEDDVDLTDKPRTKNIFLEDEAEEDEGEENDEGDKGSGPDATGHESSQDESDDEIIARKPYKKRGLKKNTMVLDSDDDDETVPFEGTINEPASLVSEIKDIPQVATSSGCEPRVPDERLIKNGKAQEATSMLGDDDNNETASQDITRKTDVTSNVKESLRWSGLMEGSTLQEGGCELDHNDDDLPATQPIETEQRHTTPPPAPSRKSSAPCNTSLEDSSSLDLLGSCIPGHQPVSSRRTMPSPLSSDACDGFTRSRGSTASLCLPMESQELLWCAVDNSSSKASCPFPATGSGGLDTGSVVEGFTNSQELRLDFRGVASPSQPREDDLQLPELLSGRFTGTGPVLPTDDKCDATQADMSNLMDLCSGQFTGVAGTSACAAFSSQPLSLTRGPSTNNKTAFDDTVLLTNSRLQTQIGCANGPSGEQRENTIDDDLLDLCSGDFEIQPLRAKGSKASQCAKGQAKLTSFFTRGKSTSKSQLPPVPGTGVVSTATVVPVAASQANRGTTIAEESEDGSASEEEEKKKEEQPGETKTRKRIIMLDDDDEEDVTDGVRKDEKDEDDDDEELEEEEEEEVTAKPTFVIYDEDENEMSEDKFAGFKDRKRGGIRADFLEKEAELSGSEVESDEEDGEDYDVMDEEEGDKEHYDLEKLRDEIGQTHHRGQLAQDQREVRLLQELYLEDGDLHGEGRQRSFRWKHLDNAEGPDEDRPTSDGEAEGEEEEDEEAMKWRQQRFEREQFLKDNEEKGDDTQAKESNGSPSSLLKTTSFPVVTKLVRVGRSSSTKATELLAPTKRPLQQANPEQDATTVPLVPRQTSLPGNLTKCGSFLSRGASKLARLASLLKEGGPSRGANANAGGKFLFQSVSAEEARLSKEVREQKDGDDSSVAPAPHLKRRRPQLAPLPVKRPRLEAATAARATSLNASIFKHL